MFSFEEIKKDNVKYAELFTNFDEHGICDNCKKKDVALTEFDKDFFVCHDCFAELVRKL